MLPPSLQLCNWSSSLVRILPFLSLMGLSVCLYFPANFLVISCFMFPWADASSASLPRSSMKFFFVCFYAVLDCSVCLCIHFLCCCFYCSRSVIVCTFPFLAFLNCTLLTVSAEIQSFCWYFFFPRTSLQVLVHISLICCHCVSMFILPSSRRSCRAVSRNVSVVTLSLRKSALYCVLVLLLTSLFYSFILILASTRWWSETASAPLSTLTSCIDFLNVRPVHRL